MPFLQLTLAIGARDPEPFEDALLAAGASAITLEDAGDAPVLEPLPGTTPLWPEVRLKALFDGATDPSALLAMLQAQLACPPESARFERLADRAWEREWLKDFRPMRFGQRLWICPGGQRPALDAAAAATACLIELDPGLAFGTGTHPTTALCLKWLDAAELSGRSVIDYGCGSGVLAIAALRLGARSAIGLDIDAQALLATRDNAARNGVADRITVGLAGKTAAGAADILLANILAEPLQQLAPTLAAHVGHGGRLVLSGVLRAQAAAVASCYAPWFDMAPAVVCEDWVRLEGIRRPAAHAC